MPIFGHSVLAHNSAVFCTISKRKISSYSKTSIATSRAPICWVLTLFGKFGIFWPELGVATLRAQYSAFRVWTPLKSSVLGPSFLVNCYPKIEFHIKVRLDPPLRRNCRLKFACHHWAMHYQQVFCSVTIIFNHIHTTNWTSPEVQNTNDRY